MEKTINLEAKEKQVVGNLQQDNLKLNARVGMLCREREDLDRRIAANEEQQRSFIRDVIFHRGIEQYVSAQISPDGGSVVCSLPDEPMGSQTLSLPSTRPNGGVAARDSE